MEFKWKDQVKLLQSSEPALALFWGTGSLLCVSSVVGSTNRTYKRSVHYVLTTLPNINGGAGDLTFPVLLVYVFMRAYSSTYKNYSAYGLTVLRTKIETRNEQVTLSNSWWIGIPVNFLAIFHSESNGLARSLILNLYLWFRSFNKLLIMKFVYAEQLLSLDIIILPFARQKGLFWCSKTK